MQIAAINARYDEIHKDKPFHDGIGLIWDEKRTPLTPFHYRDGVSIWLSKDDLTPDDDFLRQSVAQQPATDVDGRADQQ